MKPCGKFLFLVMEPDCDTVRRSLASMSNVSFKGESGRAALFDPEISPGFEADGWEAVPVDTSSHSPHGFLPRSACFLKGFHDLFPDERLAVSVPSCWECVAKVDVSQAVRVLASYDRAFSVYLGGNPLAHTDTNPFFRQAQSGMAGYLKLMSTSYDVPGLDRLCCPSVLDLAKVSSEVASDYGLSKTNRCGWDDANMVLYPEKLVHSSGDGLPEPFVDIVGFEPQYRRPPYMEKDNG